MFSLTAYSNKYDKELKNNKATLYRYFVCMPNHFSHVQLFATLWNIVWEAPLSVGFSRQEYWSGLSCPPPGDLPGLGIKPVSLALSPILQADSLLLNHLGSPYRYCRLLFFWGEIHIT